MTFLGPSAGGLPGDSGIYLGDVPPASPHADNDEFNGNSLDGSWSTLDNSGAINSLTVSNGFLRMLKGETGSFDTAGIYKPIPVAAATDFSIVASVCPVIDDLGGTQLYGLFLAEDLDAAPTTANFYTVSMFPSSGSDGVAHAATRTAYNSGGASVTTRIVRRTQLCLRIRSVGGTTLIADYSYDGFGWYQFQNIPTTLSPAAHFGLFASVQGVPGTPGEELALFNWVRVFENADLNQQTGGQL